MGSRWWWLNSFWMQEVKLKNHNGVHIHNQWNIVIIQNTEIKKKKKKKMSVQLQVKHTTKLLTLPAQCVHCAKWQRSTYTAMLKHNGRAPWSTIVPWKASSFTHLCVCAYEGSLWVRYSPLWFKVARWAYQRKTNISIIVSLQTLYFPWCSRNKTWHIVQFFNRWDRRIVQTNFGERPVSHNFHFLDRKGYGKDYLSITHQKERTE